MSPYCVVAKGVMGERVLEEVLKEAHVLHGEKGYLVFRLVLNSSKISYPPSTPIM